MSLTISPQAAYAMQCQGARLIDIRGPLETASGHAQGAELNPSLAASACINVDQAWVLICQSGKRSQALAQTLQNAGVAKVHSVEGGSLAWLREALPWSAGALNADESARYARQMILPSFGLEAQLRLKAAKVLLVGAGGLGSPALMYLAAAGVGHLAIADGDVVEASNLQRQIAHDTQSLGQLKRESAAKTVAALNPNVRCELLPAIDIDNIDHIVPRFDVVIDGSDNFPTRFLVADACVKHAKPYVYGAVLRFEGQLSVFAPKVYRTDTPCYRCLFAEPPPPESAPNCAEAGVLGVLPGVIGTLQACEAIKWVTGLGTPLCGSLLMFDALKMQFRSIKLAREPMCAVCQPGAVIHYQCDDQVCASATP